MSVRQGTLRSTAAILPQRLHRPIAGGGGTPELEETETATAVVMKKGPSIATFTADHPFFFMLRDRHTDRILSMGRVVNPTG